jgi:hypothetical protein
MAQHLLHHFHVGASGNGQARSRVAEIVRRQAIEADGLRRLVQDPMAPGGPVTPASPRQNPTAEENASAWLTTSELFTATAGTSRAIATTPLVAHFRRIPRHLPESDNVEIAHLKTAQLLGEPSPKSWQSAS